MTKRYENWTTEDAWGDEYTSRHKRFRRNKIDGVIGGVCAGIGDYFNIDPVIVRILAIIGLFASSGVLFWVYLGIWFFTPCDKRAPYRREYREARYARHKHRNNPDEPLQRTASFRDVKSKYRSLEARLQDLERSLTSSEWQLRRKFRDLEN